MALLTGSIIGPLRYILCFDAEYHFFITKKCQISEVNEHLTDTHKKVNISSQRSKALRDFLPMHRLYDKHFDIAYVTNTMRVWFLLINSVPI